MRSFIVGAAVSLLATASWADESATRDTSFDPIISDGRVVGCGISFDVFRRDPDYFNNEQVQAAGSVYVFLFPGKIPGVGLKLGVSPLFPSDAPYQPPKALFLVNDYRTNKDDQLGLNDGEPGYKLAQFKLGQETIKAVTTAQATGHLAMGYAMSEGGRLDIFDVDLSVRNSDRSKDPPVVEHDDSTLKKWTSCIDELLHLSVLPNP